jgi:hypothetical protein
MDALFKKFDRWISTGRTLPYLRLELVSYMDLRLRVRPWPRSGGGSQTGRYLCLRATDWRTSLPCHLAWAGLRPVSGGVVFSKLSKLLNQEHALSAPCLKHFRNYSGPIRVARCGFPWEKTTKRPVASRISCSAALAKNNDVRLSSRKVACSSVVPTTSTGNPGSVCIHCETAYAVISALRRHPAGRKNAADRRDPSLSISHYRLLHPVIMPTSADAFPVVGGRCTGRARRCKAKQGRRGKTALTCGYLLPQ